MKTTTFIKSIIATLLIVSSTFTVKADEGMWLIHLMAQTNYEAMKAKGVDSRLKKSTVKPFLL